MTHADFSHNIDEDRKKARNVTLQGQHLDVYRFVEANEPCTREDVSRGLDLKSSTATARIKELIDEGYLFEPGERKLNRSGVRAKTLRTTSRPMGGKPLDKVRIEIALTIDCNGVYGAEARVVDGHPQNSAFTRSIKRQRVTVIAPHPDAYRGSLQASDTDTPMQRVSRMELEAGADLIIDAEATPVDD